MNPFKILNIGPDASKKKIIQAVARAMREKKIDGRQIAQAQKMLIEPASRATQAFLYCLDVNPIKDRIVVKKPDGLGRPDIAGLSRLSIFDEEA